MSEYWEQEWRREDVSALRGYLKGYEGAAHPIIPLFHKHGVRTVCDAACGFGAYSLLLRSHGFDVSGFDISPTSVELTRALLAEYGVDASRYLTADIRRLPYADGPFDAAVAHAVLDHLTAADARTALGELCRIVKPGGLIYLSFDPMEEDDLRLAHEVFEDGSYLYTDERRNGLLFRHYGDADIARLLEGDTVIWRHTDARGQRHVMIKAESKQRAVR